MAAVRIAECDGEFIVNPSFEQIEQSSLDIVVAGTEKGITMVEGGAREVNEELMLNAIEEAHKNIKKLCELQKELRELAGKEKKPLPEEPEGLPEQEKILDYAFPKVKEACFVKGKIERIKALKHIYDETLQKFEETIPEEKEKLLRALFEEMESQIVRESIFKDKKRSDGRSPEDIRPISCEIDT